MEPHPNFNPLHPAVRSYVDSQVDDILERYATSPAFKGIVLHLTKHTIPWFGSIEAGYNDYCIEAFERDNRRAGAGGPERDPSPWEAVLRLADDQRPRPVGQSGAATRSPSGTGRSPIASRARRPDLKLALYSYSPTVTDFADDPRYGLTPISPWRSTAKAAWTPRCMRNAGNIILAQIPSTRPTSAGGMTRARRRAKRSCSTTPIRAPYAPLREARFPWVNMHEPLLRGWHRRRRLVGQERAAEGRPG